MHSWRRFSSILWTISPLKIAYSVVWSLLIARDTIYLLLALFLEWVEYYPESPFLCIVLEMYSKLFPLKLPQSFRSYINILHALVDFFIMARDKGSSLSNLYVPNRIVNTTLKLVTFLQNIYFGIVKISWVCLHSGTLFSLMTPSMFLCQNHDTDRTMNSTVFFLFKISLTVQGLLCFYMSF